MPNARRSMSDAQCVRGPLIWALSIALSALSVPAHAQSDPGFPQPSFEMMEPGTLATARLPQLENVTFKQRLDAQLPL
jgi:hypothetical protein